MVKELGYGYKNHEIALAPFFASFFLLNSSTADTATERRIKARTATSSTDETALSK